MSAPMEVSTIPDTVSASAAHTPPPKLRSPFGGGFYARLPLGVCYVYLLHFSSVQDIIGVQKGREGKGAPFC